ncbi:MULTISPECIES: hypothetical protein [unclassified Streptomyces]|nr:MULTISPECIES: hypothetical protein [unclassified Streptomyces]WSR23666.1 hypothetical protein OG573_34365 [Streptomyces sp. NBC_01205]
MTASLRRLECPLSHRAGAAALGDSVLFLDCHGDARGYQRHDYTASPTV